MKMKIIPIICLLLLTNAQLFNEEDNGVIILTDKNFKEVLNYHNNILIDFYAPWCAKCTTFAPRFEKACEGLKTLKEPVICAKIDADIYKDIAEEYNVSAFPTLIHYKDQKPSVYDGAIKDHAVVSWVKTGKSESSQSVDLAELDLMKETEHVFYAYFGDLNGKEYKMWSMVAKYDDHRLFAHSNDPKAMKKYNIKTPAVVAFRHFDQEIVQMEEEFNRINVLSFLRNSGIAKCMKFHEVDKLNIFRAKATAVFLIVDEVVEPRLLDTFCTYAKNDDSDMLYAWVSVRNRDQDDVRRYINVLDKQTPFISFVHFDIHYGLMRFDYDGNAKHLTTKDLDSMIYRFKKGGLEREFYDDQDKKWYHLSSPNPIYYKNYEEIISNSEADVIIYHYSTAEQEATFFHKELDQISKEIGRPDDLIICKYDWHKDPPVKTLSAKPNSIVLYTKDDKEKGIEYTGGKSLESLKEFLLDNSKVYRERYGHKDDL